VCCIRKALASPFNALLLFACLLVFAMKYNTAKCNPIPL
jgi:hypothetical protein